MSEGDKERTIPHMDVPEDEEATQSFPEGAPARAEGRGAPSFPWKLTKYDERPWNRACIHVDCPIERCLDWESVARRAEIRGLIAAHRSFRNDGRYLPIAFVDQLCDLLEEEGFETSDHRIAIRSGRVGPKQRRHPRHTSRA